ncbi:MAG TPA: cytochrome C, partial [Verrucomicrobiales bacterium]|nr:cytochrome C [Verrucomicrobiales bacterium]
MSDVFPKWTNKLPIRVIVGLILLGGATVVGLTYYA